MNDALATPEFDPALIARYDSRGPRYTSYPTALQFHAGFGEYALRTAIRESNLQPATPALSLYVHLPFCRSPCFYCGCNRIITRDASRVDRYLHYLQHEVKRIAPLFDPDREVRQLHLGGGTPNFLDLPRMQTLMAMLARHFPFAREDVREFGIEVDPRFADRAYVESLAQLGFNRLSLGIQDFDPAVQQAVNRVHQVGQTREVMEAAYDAGFASINVDLIYGLPRQTTASMERTLDEVIRLQPDRIALYGYAHLPDTFKAQRQIDAGELPGSTERLALFGQALGRLTTAGYVFIGMDHFARADDELARAQRAGTLQRNFQGYATHGDCDIVGLGVSAISRIGDTYSQNARDLAAYEAALDEGRLPVVRGLALDRDDLLRRKAIGELMCHGELDMPRFSGKHGIVFERYFSAELDRLRTLADDGLVSLGDNVIRVTARGRLLLRNIAMCFDAYANEAPAASYSRTI